VASIKMYLREMGGVVMAHDRDHGRALVNVVMNHLVWEVLSSCTTGGHLRIHSLFTS
jgi:hypothetical protein